MKFRTWLQGELDKRKLSRREFCAMVGCARPTLTLWLLGDRYPSKPNQKAIVKALSDGSEALRTKLILEIWELE